MANVVIYGRGFLGFENGMTRKDDPTLDIRKQAALVRFQKPTTKMKGYGTFNEAVDKLYIQLMKHERDLTSFSYRRAVLIEAMRAFGTYSFKDWCKLQTDSFYFTENHRRFLEDTLNFIRTGERQFGLRPWEFTLSQENATFQSKKVPFDYESYFSSFQEEFGSSDHSVIGTIQRWTAQPKGFEDMIISLHLIFGKTEKKVAGQ